MQEKVGKILSIPCIPLSGMHEIPVVFILCLHVMQFHTGSYLSQLACLLVNFSRLAFLLVYFSNVL